MLDGSPKCCARRLEIAAIWGDLFSILLPGIISAPAWIKQVAELPGLLGTNLPTEAVAALTPTISRQILALVGGFAVFYLLSVPLTSFLAKRGLFIGRQPNRFCFPGGQDGAGIYSKEREILASVGLRMREPPIDFWLLSVSILLAIALNVGMARKIVDFETNFIVSQFAQQDDAFRIDQAQIMHQLWIYLIYMALWIIAFVVSAIRRGRTGRL